MSIDIKKLYPFTGHTSTSTASATTTSTRGAATPVVMVHGNPSWSFYYRNLVLALRDRYRCIVPDHIGCGLSDKPGDDRYDYTLSRRVDDLERLLDHLGINGEHHPGPPRLGRDDRHGLCRPPSGADQRGWSSSIPRPSTCRRRSVSRSP